MREVGFKATVSPHIKCRPSQGTYALYIALACPMRSTQSVINLSAFAGQGLSINQLETVLESMLLYINIGEPGSQELAEKIDQQSQSSGVVLDQRY